MTRSYGDDVEPVELYHVRKSRESWLQVTPYRFVPTPDGWYDQISGEVCLQEFVESLLTPNRVLQRIRELCLQII